jgi:hypothetical protein
MNWILYNSTDHPNVGQHGMIILIHDGSQAAASSCLQPYQALLSGIADPRTQYVDPSTFEIRDKQTLDLTLSSDTVAADGVSEVTLSGLPVPCVLDINGHDVFVDDGTLEFSTDQVGTHHIFCTFAPYFEERKIVYAV